MDNIAPLFIAGLAVAFIGWAILHLSSPLHPNEDDDRPARNQFRRWLAATRKRMLHRYDNEV